MTLIWFENKCWKCKREFTNPEYVNIVKLDDGSIHYVHGGACSDVDIGKHRLPMKDGDWWIRRVGTMQPYLEVDPSYLKALNEELSTSHSSIDGKAVTSVSKQNTAQENEKP